MLAPMEGATEPIAAPPSELPEFRGPPPPRHGGLLMLVRFLRRTYSVVPHGHETDHLDVDNAVNRILAGR